MIKPLIRSMLGSMITTIIDGTSTGSSRRFLEWDSTANTYGELSAPVTFTGDFSISIDFATTSTGTQILLGDNHSTTYYFYMDSTAIKMFVAGTSKVYSHTGHNDGKLHTVKFVLTGTSMNVLLDGVSLGAQTITPYTGANNFLVGNSNGYNAYFSGTLANLIIDNNGTTLSWALDSETSTELPAQNVTGAELVINGDFSDGLTGYTLYGIGSYFNIGNRLLLTRGSDTTRVYQGFTTVVGNTYWINTTYSGGTAPATIRVGTTAGGEELLSTPVVAVGTTETHNIFFVATTTTTYLSLNPHTGTEGLTVYWDSVSLKPITNAITYYNLTTRWDATQVGNDWVGTTELLPNGTFDTDITSWTSPSPTRGTASWSAGRLRITNDGVDNYPYVNNTFTSAIGNTYQLSADMYKGTAPTMRAGVHDNGGWAVDEYPTTDYSLSETWTSGETTPIVALYNYDTGNAGSYAEFDNVSVKRILQAP